MRITNASNAYETKKLEHANRENCEEDIRQRQPDEKLAIDKEKEFNAKTLRERQKSLGACDYQSERDSMVKHKDKREE